MTIECNRCPQVATAASNIADGTIDQALGTTRPVGPTWAKMDLKNARQIRPQKMNQMVHEVVRFASDNHTTLGRWAGESTCLVLHMKITHVYPGHDKKFVFRNEKHVFCGLGASWSGAGW